MESRENRYLEGICFHADRCEGTNMVHVEATCLAYLRENDHRKERTGRLETFILTVLALRPNFRSFVYSKDIFKLRI